MPDNTPTSPAAATDTETGISGKWVVLGLLCLGLAGSSVMWVYWYWHLSPFFPVTKAISDEFPKSAPRVEGGREKKSPMKLRVIMQVRFEPKKELPEVRHIARRVVEITREKISLEPYEIFDLYLVLREPEQPVKSLHLTFLVRDLDKPWPTGIGSD